VLDTTLSFLDKIKPEHVVLHDVFDGDSISHHQMKDPFIQYGKEMTGTNDLEKEVNAMMAGLESFEKFKNVVIHAQYKNKMVFRRANSSDVNITFEWASNAVVRQYALTKNKIEFESHTVWFNSKVNDPNVYYYLAMVAEQPVGSIRFDLVENDAVISYLIDPKFHGNGFGKKIVEEGIALFRLDSQTYSIAGIVKNENKPSLKIFRDLNFKEEFLTESTIKFKL
jgi:RimJ/RimL family protein N-acetyltransferase